MARSTPNRIIVMLLVATVAIFAAACSGGADAGLASTLPEDGELGEGWLREGEPRSGEGEAAVFCGVNLANGMREGAKLDLVHPTQGSGSTFHRRYDDDAAARKAFASARSQLAACPEPGLDVGAKARPEAGDEAFFVVLTSEGDDEALAGWTIVRTGTDIRSLLVSPGAAQDATIFSAQMENLSQALATT